ELVHEPALLRASWLDDRRVDAEDRSRLGAGGTRTGVGAVGHAADRGVRDARAGLEDEPRRGGADAGVAEADLVVRLRGRAVAARGRAAAREDGEDVFADLGPRLAEGGGRRGRGEKADLGHRLERRAVDRAYTVRALPRRSDDEPVLLIGLQPLNPAL